MGELALSGAEIAPVRSTIQIAEGFDSEEGEFVPGHVYKHRQSDPLKRE